MPLASSFIAPVKAFIGRAMVKMENTQVAINSTAEIPIARAVLSAEDISCRCGSIFLFHPVLGEIDNLVRERFNFNRDGQGHIPGDAGCLIVEPRHICNGFGRQLAASGAFCFDTDCFGPDCRDLLGSLGIITGQAIRSFFGKLARFSRERTP